MNTTHLHEFLVLSKLLSFSRAAQLLYISQPVLSKHIAELERELGTPLLKRSTHGVALTDAGRILAREGPELISKCSSALRRLRSPGIGEQTSVRIALSLEFSYSSHIRGFCRDFLSRYPDIELIYDVHTDGAVLHDFIDYDLFFSPCLFPDLPENTSRLLSHHYGAHAFIPAGHPLMSKSTVSLHQLSGQTIIVPCADDIFGPYVKNYMLAEKSSRGRVSSIEVKNLSTAIFLVTMGKGVCIAPRCAESLLPHDGNFHIAVSDRACGFDEYLYYNETGNPAAKLFFQEYSERLGESAQ